jgi:hypothetical protein
MIFNILKITQTYSYSQYEDGLRTSFEVGVADEDNSCIEIGETCIVSSPNNFHARDKTRAEVSVTFYDIANLEETAPPIIHERLRATKDPVIGVASFHPELVDDEYSSPPMVIFSVWLSSKGYTHLLEQLRDKNFPTKIRFGLVTSLRDDDEGLSYGRGSDGRHKIWKLKPEERAFNAINIDDAWLDYLPFQRTPLDITVAEVTQERDQEAKKVLLANRDEIKPFGLPEMKRELGKIHHLLLISTIILGLIAFKFW